MEGGAITTNDKKIYSKLILLRSHSLKKTKISDPYVMVYPTLNFRMCEMSALIGIEQLKVIDKFKLIRNKIVNYYLVKLKKLDNYLKPINFKEKNIFWHLFCVHLNKTINKSKFMKLLKKEKIGSQVHYKPLYKHLSYRKNILINDCLNSNYFYKHQLTLPLHTHMSFKDVDYIIKKIKKILNKKYNAK